MKTSVVALSLLFSVLACADTGSNQNANPVWITDVIIISPESLDHIEKGSVLIENGRIARVERNQRGKKPAGATVVAGNGQFLIPGLIDSHVHLASVPGVPFDPNDGNQEMIRQYFTQLPRSYLYFGYTTLVDLAVYRPQVLEDFRQAPLHPDLYDCGGSLPFANGYPMSFAPPATRFKPFPNFIYDAEHADRIRRNISPRITRRRRTLRA